MWSHFDLRHPATRQQHHLQVEQIGRQVACGLGNVKAHSREDRAGENLRHHSILQEKLSSVMMILFIIDQ